LTRDIEVVDSELRLLQAIRRVVREAEGRPPSTARIDHGGEQNRSLIGI
jgi:hypothetical protein